MVSYNISEIKHLIREGYTNPEIADKLQISRATVSNLVTKKLGGNSNYLDRVTKYSPQMKEKIFKYFLNHTLEETAALYGLTDSEIKSVFTCCYRDPEFKKYRKDKRTKEKWSSDQLKEMLRCIGLLPRSEIASRISRGNSRVIKEKLMHLGLTAPKYLNGLTLSRFRHIFKCEPRVIINTKAGPGRGAHSATYFKIVPWVWIADALAIKYIEAPKAIVSWVNAMSDFQKTIHEGNVYLSLSKIIPFENWDVNI